MLTLARGCLYKHGPRTAVLPGVGCLAVTFTVGGLSAINAVAGAYAENLPIICITGVRT